MKCLSLPAEPYICYVILIFLKLFYKTQPAEYFKSLNIFKMFTCMAYSFLLHLSEETHELSD